MAGFSYRQEMAAGAQVQAAEIPRHGGLQLLAPGIAGELKVHLIHFEISIPEGRQVQAGLQRLGVPGQARALKVQAGVDRTQALDRLRLEVLNFLELGRGQALEVQVELKDRGLDPGVEVPLMT